MASQNENLESGQKRKMVYEEKEEGEAKKMKSALRGAKSLHSDEDEDETVADGMSAEKGEEGLGNQKPSNDVTKEFTLPNETESQKSSNGITLVNETREFGNQKHCEEDWKSDKFHVCCVDDEGEKTSWGFKDLYGEAFPPVEIEFKKPTNPWGNTPLRMPPLHDYSELWRLFEMGI